MVQQSALRILEKALHRKTGHGVKSVSHFVEGFTNTPTNLFTFQIREKSLYSLAWLSRVDEVNSQLGSKLILKGMRRELKSGLLPARYTVVQMLLNMHSKYEYEESFVLSVRPLIVALLNV